MKARNKTVILLAVIALILAGCVSTQVDSITNPQFQGKKFNRILVNLNITNIQTVKAFEGKFSIKARETLKQTAFIPAYSVFMPGENISKEELQKRLAEKEIKSLLIVTPTNYSEQQVYLPQTSTTQSNYYASGNQVYGQSQTYTYGGFNVSKPRITYQMKLYDVESGKLVWNATALSRGNAHATIEEMLRSLINETISKLQMDGLVQ